MKYFQDENPDPDPDGSTIKHFQDKSTPSKDYNALYRCNNCLGYFETYDNRWNHICITNTTDYKLLLKKFISNIHEDINMESVIPMTSSVYDITNSDNEELASLMKEVASDYNKEYDEDKNQQELF